MPFADVNKFKVGQVVSYHPFVGKAPVSCGHEITAVDTVPNAYGENVAWITGKAGCISFNCLGHDFADDAIYLLRDSRSNVGTNMLFWSIGGAGYTTDTSKAQRYTLEQARDKYARRDSDIPVPYKAALKLANDRVDMQYLDEEKALTHDCTGEFVLQVPSRYDGNDILFITSLSGETSFNYQDALVIGGEVGLLELMGLSLSYKVWTKPFIDSIARKAVQVSRKSKALLSFEPIGEQA